MPKYDREEVLIKIQPFIALLPPDSLRYCGNGGESSYQLCIGFGKPNTNNMMTWIDWMAALNLEIQYRYSTMFTIHIEDDNFLMTRDWNNHAYIPV